MSLRKRKMPRFSLSLSGVEKERENEEEVEEEEELSLVKDQYPPHAGSLPRGIHWLRPNDGETFSQLFTRLSIPKRGTTGFIRVQKESKNAKTSNKEAIIWNGNSWTSSFSPFPSSAPAFSDYFTVSSPESVAPEFYLASSSLNRKLSSLSPVLVKTTQTWVNPQNPQESSSSSSSSFSLFDQYLALPETPATPLCLTFDCEPSFSSSSSSSSFDTTTMGFFSHLPDELIERIGLFLDGVDINNWMMTCRNFMSSQSSTLRNSEKLWKNALEKRCLVPLTMTRGKVDYPTSIEFAQGSEDCEDEYHYRLPLNPQWKWGNKTWRDVFCFIHLAQLQRIVPKSSLLTTTQHHHLLYHSNKCSTSNHKSCKARASQINTSEEASLRSSFTWAASHKISKQDLHDSVLPFVDNPTEKSTVSDSQHFDALVVLGTLGGDPYIGDTPKSRLLPMICFRQEHLPKDATKHQETSCLFSQGEALLSPPVCGIHFRRPEDVQLFVDQLLGTNHTWSLTEFHCGWGWNAQFVTRDPTLRLLPELPLAPLASLSSSEDSVEAKSGVKVTQRLRAWVWINDQGSNLWN